MRHRAAVLVHGFSGTEKSMEPIAKHLEAEGWHVENITLPGHGTHWRDLGRVRWTSWCAAVDQAIDDAKSTAGSEKVAVVGLSMGGALALRAAAMRTDISRLVLVNPSLGLQHPLLPLIGVLKRIIPSIQNGGRPVNDPAVSYERYPRIPMAAVHELTKLWADMNQRLDQVTTPLVIFRSLSDGSEGEWSSRQIMARSQSEKKSEIILELSGHAATVDYDSKFIAHTTLEFLGQ